MTLTQLIAAAGGLNEEAYTQIVELSRHDFSNIEKAGADHFAITLSDALNDPSKDPQLQPYDVISVRTIPEFRETLSISLKGEVRFPGNYTFKRGEKLSEVIKRAGGLTELAHIDAAVFTRQSLREQEDKQLQELRQRLRADIAASSLEKTNEGKSAGIDDSAKILSELDASQALGRLVIDLGGILDTTMDDVTIKDGDLLVIPEYRQEISVVGEIQHSSAHLFNRKLNVEDYIDLSGGVNNRADRKRIYIVKADGSVALPGRSGWFKRRHMRIEPGDTIIVPLDIDRRRALTVWGEASAIIYQLALGAAAINSF
jgi:protein involved in polysaccharide export with SLBB domain